MLTAVLSRSDDFNHCNSEVFPNMASWLEMGSLMVKPDDKILDWPNRQSNKKTEQPTKESQSRTRSRPATSIAAAGNEGCECKCCLTFEEEGANLGSLTCSPLQSVGLDAFVL
jgi:hypothetical protein